MMMVTVHAFCVWSRLNLYTCLKNWQVHFQQVQCLLEGEEMGMASERDGRKQRTKKAALHEPASSGFSNPTISMLWRSGSQILGTPASPVTRSLALGINKTWRWQ